MSVVHVYYCYLTSLPLVYTDTAHRVVPVGEASVMIAASSEHRKEAIEAVAHAIDAVKSTATIWKKVYLNPQATLLVKLSHCQCIATLLLPLPLPLSLPLSLPLP